MRKVMNLLSGISLLLVVICGIAVSAGSASAQQCFLEICKSAPGAPADLGFTINFTGEEIKPFSVELFDGGDCYTLSFFTQQSVIEITEEMTEGWPLLEVDCEPIDGFSFMNVPDGVDAVCNTVGEVSTTCTFVNGRPITNIPTLSEWGMIAAVAGLVIVGVFFAVRRRRMSEV